AAVAARMESSEADRTCSQAIRTLFQIRSANRYPYNPDERRLCDSGIVVLLPQVDPGRAGVIASELARLMGSEPDILSDWSEDSIVNIKEYKWNLLNNLLTADPRLQAGPVATEGRARGG